MSLNFGDSSNELDAPPEHLVSTPTVIIGLVSSIIFCIVCTQVAFPHILSLSLTILAVLLALIMSIMGVRALGETDINPVSGISKLTQLFFAFVTPPSSPNAIVINLIAGAVSEAGAQQAGDIMQDLKTGHLVGASPKAQFYGQLLGSTVGCIASAAVYKLYTSVYDVPGDLFQVPTAYVWVFTARLVTGRGLPEMAWQVSALFAVVFAACTVARIMGQGTRWQAYVPGGIAVAVGMYNVPSFTMARAVGGLVSWWWRRGRREEMPLIVLASGLILGEGVVSIINLVLASLRVTHL
jgi:OPT family oligopeptide transporter